MNSLFRRVPLYFRCAQCHSTLTDARSGVEGLVRLSTSPLQWTIRHNMGSSSQSRDVASKEDSSPPAKGTTQTQKYRQNTGSVDVRNAYQEVVVDGKVDYDYFRSIVKESGRAPTRKGVVNVNIDPSIVDESSTEVVPASGTSVNLSGTAPANLQQIKPKKPDRSATLAAYINESESLTKLLQLKVDLSKLEKNSEVANFLVKSSFENDVKPYLLFLHKIGISPKDYGSVLTKAPEIFLQDLANLEIHVNYFEAKRFDAESICRIVTNCPKVLTVPVKKIDGNLGFIQKTFELSGDEVRQVVTRYPKVAIWHHVTMQDINLTWKDFMGFSANQRKEIVLAYPKLLLTDKDSMLKRFDFVHNVIGFSHEDIVRWPNVLRKRIHDIKERHLFLEHIGRAQYNPALPNYVSLRALTTKRDIEFCQDVAKASVKQYNEFLKTL